MKLMKLTTVMALALAATLSAQPGHQGKGDGTGPRHQQMVQELGLTADQQAKLTALRNEHQSSQKVIHEQLKTKRTELDGLIKSGASTDGKVKELNALHEKLLLSRVDHLAKVKGIMSADQFEKFMARKENHQMGNGQGYGRGNGNGQGKGKGKGYGNGKGQGCCN